ncbi:MAG: ParB/RepB/Spo0J family partition protein [Planctomycetaceae bacterium]|nr:ParB/RepB/Spo0J family partition protein [Planctomycetaceae bacterium]
MQVVEQIQSLPLSSIQTTRQVREQFDLEELQGMAATLEVGTLQQPIRVQQTAEGYKIIDGERRYRAARMAGWTTIPAIVEREELSEGEILEKQLVANCVRSDLTSLEKARGMQRLIETTGWTPSQVCQRLGMSAATLSRLLSLLILPLEIQDRIEGGEIPSSTGYELARISDPEAQAQLASQVAATKLTRDDVVRKQRRACRTVAGREARATPLSRAVALLGNGSSVSVSGADLDFDRFIEMLEQILSRSRKGRQQGISLSTFLKVLRDEVQAHPRLKSGRAPQGV